MARVGYTRDQILILVFTLTASILAGTSLGLPPPFLPKLDEKYNLSSAVTGWIIGTFPLVHCLCIPAIFKCVPKIGLYEVNAWGLFFNGGCTVLFGTLEYFPPVEYGTNWGYVIIAFIIRTFQAIGSSAWYNANMTILAMSFPRDTTTVLAYSETLYTLGAMASPAVGAVLYEFGGFMGVFGGVGAARMLISLLMLFFLPKCQRRQDANESGEDEGKSVKCILSDPKLVCGLIFLGYGGMVWSSLEPILEPELRKEFGLTTSVSALCFVILAGTYTIASQIMAKSLDRGYCIDRILLMGIGSIICSVAYVFAGPPPFLPFLPRPLWLLLSCVGLLGISCSFYFITSLNILFDRGDGIEENTATNSILAGLFAAGFDIGSIIGPVISGAITASRSFSVTTTWFSAFSLVLLLFSLIFYCLSNISTKRRSRDSSLTDEDTLLIVPNFISVK